MKYEVPTVEQFARAAELTRHPALAEMAESVKHPNAFLLSVELQKPDLYREAEAAANRAGEYELADAMGKWADLRAHFWDLSQREKAAVAAGRVVDLYNAPQLHPERQPTEEGGFRLMGRTYYMMMNHAGLWWEE